MLPTRNSDATASRTAITASRIFTALVTSRICWVCWPVTMSSIAALIGCGLPVESGGESAVWTDSMLSGLSTLTLKAGGSGLRVELIEEALVLEPVLEDLQRRRRRDVLDGLDVRDPRDLVLERGDLAVGRVVEEEDLELELAADVVGLRAAGVEDRHEDADQQHGDGDRHDRGQRGGGVAAQGPVGLAEEEREAAHSAAPLSSSKSSSSWSTTPSSERTRAPNSEVSSSVAYMPAAWSRITRPS